MVPEHIVDQVAHGEWPDRGDIAADVVAERGAGAAQARREQLGEVNRITAEEHELAEAHERNHPKDVVEAEDAVEIPERARGAQQGQHEGNAEGGASAGPFGEVLEEVDAEGAAEVL